MNDMSPMTPKLIALDEKSSMYATSSLPPLSPKVSMRISFTRSMKGCSTPNADRNAMRNVRHGMIAMSVEYTIPEAIMEMLSRPMPLNARLIALP